MPIDWTIDHARRLVVAHGRGIFRDADIFGYQQAVWSRADVAGYDELVDVSGVTRFAMPTPPGPRMRQLAGKSAAQDVAGAGKFAIVAPEPLAFGLAREYQVYRELDTRNRKEVGVFRTLAEALAFLGVDSLERPGSPGEELVAHPLSPQP